MIDNRDPVRTFRIPPVEWHETLAIAKANGDNLSKVIRDGLAQYRAEHSKDRKGDAEDV